MKTIAVCLLALVCGACVSTRKHEALREQLLRGEEGWVRAEFLKQHHIHVIMILQHMPKDAHEFLSLDEIGFHEDGRIDLRPMAKADLEAGRVQILDAGGYLHPWVPYFERMMKEKYGLTYVGFGLGCVTDKSVRTSVAEYNALADEFIRKKHPAFDRTQEMQTFVEQWRNKQGVEKAVGREAPFSEKNAAVAEGGRNSQPALKLAAPSAHQPRQQTVPGDSVKAADGLHGRPQRRHWTHEIITLLMATVFDALSMAHAIAYGEVYTQTPSGLIHGPYRFEAGEDIRGGTIVAPSKRKIDFQKRLEQTIIPFVDFRQADVRDAVAFLEAASRNHSPIALPPGDVQIDLDLTGYIPPVRFDLDPFMPLPDRPEQPMPVTFAADYISILEAIKIVAAITGLSCEFGEDTVTMAPNVGRRDAQQDESTVPSKAAPSTSFDVR